MARKKMDKNMIANNVRVKYIIAKYMTAKCTIAKYLKARNIIASNKKVRTMKDKIIYAKNKIVRNKIVCSI